MINIVFFGTHNFATVILQGLIDDPNINVVLVITQPDKPVGRKKVMTAPPVKLLAEKHGLKIDQPTSLKDYQFPIESCHLGITAQYGLLIPKAVLDFPKHGILNTHTSLLPKYRGASPIQSALINGETTTGVTIMKMDVGLDTGPILLQKEITIEPDDTYLDVDTKLAPVSKDALLEAIPPYVSGELVPQEQDESQVTKCSQFSREDGKIDWNKSTTDIYNQYRGLTPWPGVWTEWNGKRLKLITIKPANKTLNPGQVLIEDNRLFIGTADQSIEALELQLEGKPKSDAKTFVNGYKQIQNEILI